MSALLSQLADAAHPDRGTVGCHVAFTTGLGREVVMHTLSTVPAVLHIRCAIAPGNLTGGAVTFLRLTDTDGATICDAVIDPDEHSITVLGSGQPAVSAMYEPQRPWICVEVAFNQSKSEVALSLDAQAKDDVSWDLSQFEPADVELGCCEKDYAATGSLDLDEWIVGTGSIGLVAPASGGTHADDPAHWMVIYRLDDADSTAFAVQCHAQRGVPLAHVLGVSAPSSETMTNAEATAVLDAIDERLADRALHNTIAGFWLAHGLPGLVDNAGVTEPFSKWIQEELGTAGALPISTDERPTVSMLASIPMVCRCDSPTLAGSTQILSRSAALSSDDVLERADTGVLLDWGHVAPQADVEPAIANAGVNVGTCGASGSATMIDNHAFLISFDRTTSATGFLDDADGELVLAIQMSQAGDSVGLLRNASDTSFAPSAMRAGYAAVAAYTSDFSNATPDIARLIRSLEHGWTIAEAIYAALSGDALGLVLIGDPFMVIPMARDAVEVLWARDEPTTEFEVIAHLSPMQNSFTLPAEYIPDDGDEVLLALQRVDRDGRPAATSRWRRVRRVGDGLVTIPPPPLFPCRSDWRPDVTGSEMTVRLVLPARPCTMGLSQITLQRELPDGTIADLAQIQVDDQDAHLTTTVALIVGDQRFRWRLTTTASLTVDSPWSSWITPVVADAELTGVSVGVRTS
ncbi:MAG: hypothetical protein KAS72_08470 [Phycisphaerales bacterium]|nr:hypothetical protein [Phycisphaerales bacterium]